MGNNFTNIQIALHFLSTFVVRCHQKVRSPRVGGKGLAYRSVCSKINKLEKKITHPEIIDCIPEKVVSMISQECKESNLCIHFSLQQPNSSFTYSLKFFLYLFLYCRYMNLRNFEQRNFVKDNKEPFTFM